VLSYLLLMLLLMLSLSLTLMLSLLLSQQATQQPVLRKQPDSRDCRDYRYHPRHTSHGCQDILSRMRRIFASRVPHAQ
jgi:hypothetical protein